MNNQPNREPSATIPIICSQIITRQIDQTLRASNQRALDVHASMNPDGMARRAAQVLAGDVAQLLDAVLAIANEGASPARLACAEQQAATTADTLTLFFGAANNALYAPHGAQSETSRGCHTSVTVGTRDSEGRE